MAARRSRCRRSPCRPPWHSRRTNAAVPVWLTVNVAVLVPASPSVIVTSVIEMSPTTAATASSLLMVPMPWLLTMVPPLVALNRLTKNVSSGSTVVSPLMVTETVLVRSPAAKLTVPVGCAT